MECARKVAGHEIKSLRAILSCFITHLHLPLVSTVDFLGYRVIAMSVLPLIWQNNSQTQETSITTLDFANQGGNDKHLDCKHEFMHRSSTLVYGSADGGLSVVDSSPELFQLVREVSCALNLKPHKVNKVL